MLRKVISCIFICILLIGCEYENPLTSECECESDFEMEVVASDLVIDENGYECASKSCEEFFTEPIEDYEFNEAAKEARDE